MPIGLTKEYVDQLLQGRVRERRSIEYKRVLPDNSDKDKAEFRGDVISLANTDGGDILYGVPAEDGVPVGPFGLGAADVDKEKLRLEGMIREIVPRLPAHAIESFGGYEGGEILVIRVEKSWLAPHAVRSNESFRFYYRTSAGKQPMDIDQVKRAVLAADQMPARVREFRSTRLDLISRGKAQTGLDSGSKLVIHMVPYGSIASVVSLSAQAISQQWQNLRIRGEEDSRWFNIDGFVVALRFSVDKPILSFTQAFRNGAIEGVDCTFGAAVRGMSPIRGFELEQRIIVALGRWRAALLALGVPPPYAVLLTLMGVKGVELERQGRIVNLGQHQFDRDLILAPDVLLESREEEIGGAIRPALDAIWNGAGFAESPYFDPDGSHWTVEAFNERSRR